MKRRHKASESCNDEASTSRHRVSYTAGADQIDEITSDPFNMASLTALSFLPCTTLRDGNSHQKLLYGTRIISTPFFFPINR